MRRTTQDVRYSQYTSQFVHPLRPSAGLDNDGDSQMQSDSAKATTPLPTSVAEISPPSSQGVPLSYSPTAAISVAGANANGKRPLSHSEANGEAPPALRSGQTKEMAGQVKTHAQSGYTWSKAEDEPGHSWNSRRAVEDANRAWDGVLMKEMRIGSKDLTFSVTRSG